MKTVAALQIESALGSRMGKLLLAEPLLAPPGPGFASAAPSPAGGPWEVALPTSPGPGTG